MKEHVWIESQGRRLSAMIHIPAGAEKPPVVIFCHGFTGEKVGGNQFLLQVANAVEAAGFAVVRFDFAGSGESEGSFAEDTTISGWLADLRHVVAWTKRQPAFRDSPLFLLGHSLGGCIVLLHEAQEHPVAGRIALAPVVFPEANFRDIILGRELWEASASGETISHFYGKGFSLKPAFVRDLTERQHAPLLACKGYSEPILLVHGSADPAVPAEGSRQFFEQYAGPKEYVLIEDADHSFSRHVPQVREKLTAWLLRVCETCAENQSK